MHVASYRIRQRIDGSGLRDRRGVAGAGAGAKGQPRREGHRGIPGRAPRNTWSFARSSNGRCPLSPGKRSAEQIDLRQRELASLIQAARRNEKAGDIFESDVRPTLRRLLSGVFNGRDGGRLRMAVMEENPGAIVKLQVNGRYPDTIPRSSVPPQVLRALPPLPEELEYRFIGTTLILLDARGHIIVDYMTGAVPR